MEKIDTVAMVRKIRDKQNKEIEGKSTAEIIKYFRSKAGKITQKAKIVKLN